MRREDMEDALGVTERDLANEAEADQRMAAGFSECPECEDLSVIDGGCERCDYEEEDSEE